MKRFAALTVLITFAFTALTFAGLVFFQIHESHNDYKGSTAQTTQTECAADMTGSCAEDIDTFACIDHCVVAGTVVSGTALPSILLIVSFVFLAVFQGSSFETYRQVVRQRWRDAIQKFTVHKNLLTIILRN
ncbi:MAG: hypothetical protein Q8P82_00685 [bacterium]|nr:hypothetical protein [bacterium]